MTLRVTGGGVSVIVQGDAVEGAEGALDRLASDGVPAALMAGNASLWGLGAAERAARRMGWVDLPDRSRRLLPGLADLATRFAGRGDVLLAGTGGSAVAAEVIARNHGGSLTLLDTSDPDRVRGAIGRLDRTVLVVSGKDDAAVETDAVMRVVERAFGDAGIDPAERTVVVTDPGSALEASAREAGHTVVLADPDTEGCYGALGAHALVPSVLSGADVPALLDEAAALVTVLRQPYDNPGLALGAALGASAAGGRDRLLITGEGPGLAGFACWAGRLVSDSTGKDGHGILPVVVEDVTAPGFDVADDVRRVVLGGHPGEAALSVSGPLGAQFLLWEYATAVACRLIGVSPFDGAYGQASEDEAAELLHGDGGEPALVDGDIEVYGGEELAGATDLAGVLDAVIGAVPAGGYLAVMAHLDRTADASAGRLRPLLAGLTGSPVTFEWGPGLLHCTGRLHLGGPPVGAFLQITGSAREDVEVPGRPYGLAALQLARARGDVRALRTRGRPVVRLHLRDRAAGLVQLEKALGG